MKRILLLLVLCAPGLAQTIGGVDAPHAITLRITQVAVVSEPLHVVEETSNPEGCMNKSGYAPCWWSTVKESTSGYKLVGESSTVRYSLSCVVHDREEMNAKSPGDESTETHFEDGLALNWTRFGPVEKNYPNGVGSGGLHIQTTCERFHVGMTVVFYSLDRLVWLSKTDTKGVTYTHNAHWKPYYLTPTDFWTLKVEFEPQHNDMTGETSTPSMTEKQYTIDSEEEIPAATRPKKRTL